MPPPLIPPEKARLNQELKLTGEYKLRNKHEVKLKVQLQLLRQVIVLLEAFHSCWIKLLALAISVIYTFYFYTAFEELVIYQTCLIKYVLYSLFY